MRWIPLAILLTVTFVARGAEPLLSKLQLAQIMGYPAGKLIVQDDTAFVRRGPGILNSSHYYSADDTFADMFLTVADAGKLLTPEVRARYDGVIAKFASKDPSIVRRIGIKGQYEGYVGVDGFGAGGIGYHALITIPSRKLDVELLVSISYNTELKKTPETAVYHDNILSEDPFASDRLKVCTEQIVRNVLDRPHP